MGRAAARGAEAAPELPSVKPLGTVRRCAAARGAERRLKGVRRGSRVVQGVPRMRRCAGMRRDRVEIRGAGGIARHRLGSPHPHPRSGVAPLLSARGCRPSRPRRSRRGRRACCRPRRCETSPTMTTTRSTRRASFEASAGATARLTAPTPPVLPGAWNHHRPADAAA